MLFVEINIKCGNIAFSVHCVYYLLNYDDLKKKAYIAGRRESQKKKTRPKYSIYRVFFTRIRWKARKYKKRTRLDYRVFFVPLVQPASRRQNFILRRIFFCLFKINLAPDYNKN